MLLGQAPIHQGSLAECQHQEAAMAKVSQSHQAVEEEGRLVETLGRGVWAGAGKGRGTQ